jgi:S1-C subfamily serine protease
LRFIPHLRNLTLIALAVAFAASTAQGQFVKELYNNQGASAPCVGIEIGLGLIKKCVDTFANAGFIRVNELGFSGLTLGTSAVDDGAITAIAPGSPAEQAGLQVGDRILSVEGTSIRPAPGAIAQKALFGPKGDDVRIKLKRVGTPLDVIVKRAPLPPPPAPKSPGFMFVMHPLADWRNVVIPCMGAGLAMPAAFAYCDKHFRPYGYIKYGDLGTTGAQLELDNPRAAIVKSVDAGSPAASAGIQPGDELLAIDDKPLATDLSEQASERIFGHIGDVIHVTVSRHGAEKTVALTLAAKPKDN